MRATGAVALDRADPTATINRLLDDAEVDEAFLLGIAAEGTRGKTDYWKSGFYRISQKTGIPVTLAYLDRPSRTVGVGSDLLADRRRRLPTWTASGPSTPTSAGIRPELTTVARLREEDRASG